MNSYRITVLGLAIILSAGSAYAANVRLFFSAVGTVDGTIHGEAGSPPMIVDPVTTSPNVRLWLWAQPDGPATTINGLDFRIVTNHTLMIQGYNFYNHDLTVANRWESGEFPGAASDVGQATDKLVFAAVTTAGVTNGIYAPFDTQYDDASNSTLLGYVDFAGFGFVNIMFNDGAIARPGAYDRTYLGLDDHAGNLGGGPYSNANPEAIIGVPEPTSFLLLGALAIVSRRR